MDCRKIYHITLIVCAPYFVSLNNNTFRLKTLLFFVHLRSQQNRTERVISNYQIYNVSILTLFLRVAIISNVRLQPQHRQTDDASTRRLRGSQQAKKITHLLRH